MNGTERTDYSQEYRFVDYAAGCCKARNKVAQIQDVNHEAGATEGYISVYRFPEAYKTHCEKTSSVKHYSGDIWLADLPFDVDDKNKDIEVALNKARQLIKNITSKYGVDPAMLQYFFSGLKGFHVLLPGDLFGGFKASPRLHQMIKALAIEMGGNLIDKSIYSMNSLLRLANTINSKSGLYKVPLSHEEFRTKSSEEIKAMAQKPRNIKQEQLELNPVDGLVELYAKHQRQRVANKQRVPRKSDRLKANIATGSANQDTTNLACINQLLLGVEEGERNDAAIRIASQFRKEGNNPKTTLEKMSAWNERNSEELSVEELRTIVNSAFGQHYTFSCKDEFLKTYCSSSCPFYKGKEKLASVAPTLGSIIPEVQKLQQKYSRKELLPIDTPFSDLNTTLKGGLYPGLHTIVGNPGVGKSQFALQIGLDAARKGHHVMYVGLELGRLDLFARLMGIITGRKWSEFFTGELSSETYPDAVRELTSLPFQFRDSPPSGWTRDDFEEEGASFLQSDQRSSSVIIVDYLQLIKGAGHEELRSRAGQAAYVGRALAKEYSAAIIMVSSTSREYYPHLASGEKDDKKIQPLGQGNPARLMGTGKDAGEIEYASDSVIVLGKDKWVEDQSQQYSTHVHLAVAKLRYGRPAWLQLCFDGNRFSEPQHSAVPLEVKGTGHKSTSSKRKSDVSRTGR